MAALARPASTGVPMNVEQIVQQANNFEYNVQVPLRYWLRSADTIQKEAQIYAHEDNDQQRYLLLYRHAILVLDKLTKHPEAKDPRWKKGLSEAKQIVNGDLDTLEELKPRIDRRYQRYLEDKARRQQNLEAHQRANRRDVSDLAQGVEGISMHSRNLSDAALYGTKKALDAGENRLLAARLAQKEIRRRDAARRYVRQAGVSAEEEQRRRTAGSWDNWEQALITNSEVDSSDLSRDILEAGRWRESAVDIPKGNRSPNGTTFIPAPYQYQYPTIPHKSPQDSLAESTTQSSRPSSMELPSVPPRGRPDIPPKLPPKSYEEPPATPIRPPNLPPKYSEVPAQTGPPPVPGKISFESDTSEPVSRSESATPPNDLNSRDYSFKPTAYLENGTPLRTVFLPPDLRTRFLSVAAPNTRANLETCGILCGTLISNALFISKLVIPEQKSTSDTCETLNESALFDYCDAEDLMVFGWIHTHPTQTCFMSSRDLHTHYGYQVMMRESIAIVCAPSKQPSWGVFRLTDPPGMKTVLNCQQTGLFHPHYVDNIYTDALKPGHVFECPGLEFEVVDQRPGY